MWKHEKVARLVGLAIRRAKLLRAHLVLSAAAAERRCSTDVIGL